mmetsp:Transcript_56850/g.68052  ORF Transcript_56850/g.68052 Transcript_56850/m.68052 type:complete len:217 (-) Transcript_56850:22-672(-)
MHTVRQAIVELIPILNRGKRALPMTNWVTPPPRLPHPPTKAFAVPTTSLVNMRLDQNWHMTKHDPTSPMNNRRIIKSLASWMIPVNAAGIEHAHKIIVKSTLAPYLSHAGPNAKRMKIVPITLTMLLVQICSLLSPRSFFISRRRGAMENQMKNAMKKAHHEQWNARMWGRAKLHSLISVALSSWFLSTLRAYTWYFFISCGAPDSAIVVFNIDSL